MEFEDVLPIHSTSIKHLTLNTKKILLKSTVISNRQSMLHHDIYIDLMKGDFSYLFHFNIRKRKRESFSDMSQRLIDENDIQPHSNYQSIGMRQLETQNFLFICWLVATMSCNNSAFGHCLDFIICFESRLYYTSHSWRPIDKVVVSSAWLTSS